MLYSEVLFVAGCITARVTFITQSASKLKKHKGLGKENKERENRKFEVMMNVLGL